jgi:hypothetical protein
MKIIIRFTPPVPGTMILILKDVSGKEFESKEIYVIDDEEFNRRY